MRLGLDLIQISVFAKEWSTISFTTFTFIDLDLHSCPYSIDMIANEIVELIVSSLDWCLDWATLIVLLFLALVL